VAGEPHDRTAPIVYRCAWAGLTEPAGTTWPDIEAYLARDPGFAHRNRQYLARLKRWFELPPDHGYYQLTHIVAGHGESETWRRVRPTAVADLRDDRCGAACHRGRKQW
jgi:hypothetical protein